MTRTLASLHRRAFVTGASSGLGQAITRLLLSEGVEVWGTSRLSSRLVDAAPVPATGCAAAFHPVVLDLADCAAAVRAFREASRQAGGFDLVVLCAGGGVFGTFAGTPFAEWEAQLSTLCTATARLAHEACHCIHESDTGSALVLVTSLAVEFPMPSLHGYNMAKAALAALAAGLVSETRGGSLRVIDFRPGDHRTAFNAAMDSPARPRSPRLDAIWARLESEMAKAPPPARAAADLRRALLARRCGIVRSGSFFQARLAPFLARFAPPFLLRAALSWHFRDRPEHPRTPRA